MAVVDYRRPLVEIDVPAPQLRPGTARLDVLACGVCFSDLKTARGQMPYSSTLALPHIPGHEVCGRVAETDPDGLFDIGELVIVHHYWPCGRCRRCRAGDECLCLDLQGWLGFTQDGGFQEQLVVPADRILRIPFGIDPVNAAPMTCALGTAYRATVTKARAAPGSAVAVIGLGGVGIHALQIAAAAGASAIGLDISPSTVVAVRELGLDAFDAQGFIASSCGIPAVAEEGFDSVVVTAGAQSAYAQATQIVRKGGSVVCVGYALDTALQIKTPRLVLDEIRLLGSRYVTRGELEQAVELVRRGLVTPIVDKVRPLAEANEAFDDLQAGKIVGRTVLEIVASDKSRQSDL